MARLEVKALVLSILGWCIISTLSTTITVSDDVIRSDVQRLGLNFGGRSNGDHMVKNIISNPGQEAAEKAIIMLAASGSTSTEFWQGGGWNSLVAAQPDGYFNGAKFLFLTGVNQGIQGTVSNYRNDNNFTAKFTLNPSLPQAISANDVMVVYKKFPAAFKSVQDARPNSPGVQSRNISNGDTYQMLLDGGYRDVDYTAGKMFLVNGTWTISFWLKGAANQTVNFFFGRENWAGGATFLSKTYTLNVSNTWTHFEDTIQISPNADPPNYPTGPCQNHPFCQRPFIQIYFQKTSGTSVLLDDVSLSQNGDTNPTVFTDRVLNLIKEYNPGTLRYWGGQFGASLKSEISTEFARGTHGYKPNSNNLDTFDYSFGEFLQFCKEVGADPWYVVPPTFFPDEAKNLIEYLAAPSTTTYGAMRAAQGQEAPWTSVFGNIYLEYGNELWGAGSPTDPFGGASMGAVNEGKALEFTFSQMKNSTYFSNKIQLVAGGQAGYVGNNQNIEQNAKSHDRFALAPYYGSLSNGYGSPEEKYRPLWAFPVQERRLGNFKGTYDVVTGQNNSTKMSIYEINFHYTSTGGAPPAVRNPWMTGVGGGINLPWTMLNYLQYYGSQPNCAFSFLGYSFLYDGYLSPFQCIQDSGCKFAKVWGLMRDLSGLGTKRPGFLAAELTNRAIYENMIATSHSDSTGWTQTPLNGITNNTDVPYLNSFAFSDGEGHYSLLVFNFHLTSALPIAITTPNDTEVEAVMYRLTSQNLEDGNEVSQNVDITTANITSFASGYSDSLPPFSLTAYLWTRRAPDASSTSDSTSGTDGEPAGLDESAAARLSLFWCSLLVLLLVR